ncbi:MAG: hypothetical protein JNJ58_06175 [Chitinophagaceae bacterium]|nr:hypothetical protein [Chitinophagaceae bacterium]
MKSLLNILILITLLNLSLSSCTKKNENTDIEKPYIAVVEPEMDDTLFLSTSPEIHIEFTVTDNTSLHSLHVELRDAANQVYYSFDPSVMGLSSYPFHEHPSPTGLTTTTNMKVVITALDHHDNTETKEISFVVVP